MKNFEVLKNEIELLINSSKYEDACNLVANEFGIKIDVKFKINGKHFSCDKENRDIYEITLSKGKRAYTFDFGQSLHCSGQYIVKKSLQNKVWVSYNTNGKIYFTLEEFKKIPSFIVGNGDIIKNPKFKEPNLYDILTCLQKYDIGTFEDFCSEFGYNEDSKSAEETYNSVVEEFEVMQRFFSDEELEILSYIQ